MQTIPWHCNTKKLQPKTWPTDKKKLIPSNHATKFTNAKKKERSSSHLLHLCLDNIWAQGPRIVCICKSSNFSKSSQARNIFPAPAGPPTSKCLKGIPYYYSESNYCVKRSRTSKDSWLQKTLKTEHLVSKSYRQIISSIIPRKRGWKTHKNKKYT